jgi:hypothetical protein
MNCRGTMIAQSRFLRAFILASSIYSFLIGLYVVGRVIALEVYEDDVLSHPFIDEIPSVTFGILALVSLTYFVVSAAVYVHYWGWPKRPFAREKA